MFVVIDPRPSRTPYCRTVCVAPPGTDIAAVCLSASLAPLQTMIFIESGPGRNKVKAKVPTFLNRQKYMIIPVFFQKFYR